ncbi:hypothetical protein JW752_03340 [Candidatus Peregrinibacteria bacterium]|nr:hypothetical protein [Candidatus Peregrinibacteria bacterium]
MSEKLSDKVNENQKFSLSVINQKRLEILKEFFCSHPDQPAFDDQAVIRYLNDTGGAPEELKRQYPFFAHVLNFANISFLRFLIFYGIDSPSDRIAYPMDSEEDEEAYIEWIDRNNAYFDDDLAIFRSYTLLLKTLRPDYAMIAKEVLRKHLIAEYQSSGMPIPPQWLLGLPHNIVRIIEASGKNPPPDLLSPQTKEKALSMGINLNSPDIRADIENTLTQDQDPAQEEEQRLRFADAFKDLDKLAEQLIGDLSVL